MVYEFREYTFDRSGWPLYLALLRDVGMPMRRHRYGRLVSAWTTVLEQDERIGFVHLWAYESLDARAQLRADLLANTPWLSDYFEHVKSLVKRQHISVLNANADNGEMAVQVDCVALKMESATGMAPAALDVLRPNAFAGWTAEFPDPNYAVVFFRDEASARQAANACLESGVGRAWKLAHLNFIPELSID